MVSTQTALQAEGLKELVEKYWRCLDRRNIDQATEPFQCIIGSSGGLRSSIAGSQSEAAQPDDEEETEDELDEHYFDEFDYDMELEQYMIALESERNVSDLESLNLDEMD